MTVATKYPPVAKLRLLRQIAADAGVTLAAIKTAIVLLDRVNSGTGRCYPSYDSLARDTKLSRRSVINVSRTRFPWTQNWLNRSVQGGPEHDR